MPRKKLNGVAPPTPRYASIQDTADYYGIEHKTIRRWIATGLIHGYRIGDRLLRVDLNEIEANVVQEVPTAGRRKPAPARTGR